MSVNGSLIFPDRETLTFGSQGTVEEVLVAEGEQVRKGQPLVRLDAETIAGLERAVAQATFDLRDANEALAQALDPHSALDLAVAEADVADARVLLKEAQDALELLLEPTAEDTARAEVAVANARVLLSDAREALDRLLDPTPGDVAQAETAAAAATVGLNVAQEDLAALLEPSSSQVAVAEEGLAGASISAEKAREELDLLKSGGVQEDIAKARSQVDSAETSLANARRDLELAQNQWDDNVQAAQDSVDTAVEAYQGVYVTWLGIEISLEESGLVPDSLLDGWGVDLASLFGDGARYLDVGGGLFAPGFPSDDPDTAWNERVVFSWLNFYPGDLVVTCEAGSTPFEGACVRREIDDAWTAYEAARDSLNTTQTQAAKAVSTAEDAAARAEDSLTSATDALTDLSAEPDPLDIRSAEARLALALATREEAEDDLAALMNGPDPADLEVKESQVAKARADLDQVLADLAALASEPDRLQLDLKRKQVAVAGSDLAELEVELNGLKNGVDQLDLGARRGRLGVAEATLAAAEEELAELRGSVDPLEVALATARLEAAVERLEKSNLTAPWDGFVSVLNVEAGQAVNPNTPVVEVVDPAIVELDGIVDEIDVVFVREGARATVTMDALSGQVLEGSVSSISSAALNQQGVVTFPIRIKVEVPAGLELKEGLNATARVVIREETNVLLIPVQTIFGSFDQPTVLVMDGGGIQERPVTLGNSDGFWTVVIDGLQEGDQVAMQIAEASTDPFAQIRQRFQAGGGGNVTFGGGGGRGGGGGGGFGIRR